MGKFSLVLTILIIVLCVNSEEINRKKCRALVLEGGGDKGSFQVGVLKAFVDNLDPEEIKWDVITGVSVGSINTAALALHEIGKEKEAVDWMVNLWESFKKSDIYVNWPLGLVQGWLMEEGIWDNMPEENYLRDRFKEFTDKKLKRKVNFNTCDLNTGELYRFNETVDWDIMPTVVRASTAMPLAFRHAHIDGKTFVDGGSVWNLDLTAAIDRCKEITPRDEDITVDVVMCSSQPNKTYTGDSDKPRTAIDNFVRFEQIRKFYGSLGDYCEVKRGYPNIKFRYVAAPEEKLPSGFLPLAFDHDKMVQMVNMGYEEGMKVINGSKNYLDKQLSNPNHEIYCPENEF